MALLVDNLVEPTRTSTHEDNGQQRPTSQATINRGHHTHTPPREHDRASPEAYCKSVRVIAQGVRPLVPSQHLQDVGKGGDLENLLSDRPLSKIFPQRRAVRRWQPPIPVVERRLSARKK